LDFWFRAGVELLHTLNRKQVFSFKHLDTKINANRHVPTHVHSHFRTYFESKDLFLDKLSTDSLPRLRVGISDLLIWCKGL
jgi:hypothetical protein